MCLNVQQTIVVIPALNEAAHIGRLLQSLLVSTDGPPIWVFDGGSSDATCDIVRGYARLDPRVCLHRNPGKTQAHAVNCAAVLATGQKAQFLIRMDAHAKYAPDFVNTVEDCLLGTAADSVVVPLCATGKEGWRAAAADLQRSWLGNGGAVHRARNYRGWVAHGHHAGFRLESFMRLGGYDTDFVANEDAEFDHRLGRRGGRIFLESRAPVGYIPRKTPAALWQQMFRNGYFRVKSAQKHKIALGFRQQLPVLTTLCLVTCAVLTAHIGIMAALPLKIYLGGVFCLAVGAAGRKTPLRILRVSVLAVVSHIGFGTGALWRMAKTAGGFWANQNTLSRVPK